MSSHSQSYMDLQAAQAPEQKQETLSGTELVQKAPTGSPKSPLAISIEIDLAMEGDTVEHASPPVERRASLATPTSTPVVPVLSEVAQAGPVNRPSTPEEMPPPPPVPIPMMMEPDTIPAPSGTAAYGRPVPAELAALINPLAPVQAIKDIQETRHNIRQVGVKEVSSLLPDEETSSPPDEDAAISISVEVLSALPAAEAKPPPPVARPSLPRQSTTRQRVHTSSMGTPMRQTATNIQTPPPASANSSTGVRIQSLQPRGPVTPAYGSRNPMDPKGRPTQAYETSGLNLSQNVPIQKIGASQNVPIQPIRSSQHIPIQGLRSSQNVPIQHLRSSQNVPVQQVLRAPAHLPVQHQLPQKRGVQHSNPQAHLPAYVSPSREEIQQVKQIVHLIHRAYQAFEFYPFNHPIVQQFSKQLFQQLQGFFRFREMLELRLDRFKVLYCEQTIFEEKTLTNNFAYLLFSDGIRKLIIDSGITEDEYIRFFMVLHRSSTRRSISEDTITLLWEQQFAFIRYFLVEDLTEMFLPDLQALYDNLEQQDSQGHSGAASQGSQQAVQIMGGLARARLSLSEEEQQTLQQLVQDEERGLMQRFLEIIARVLEHGEEGLELDRLVRVLSQLQPILLSVGEIEHLALCLYYTSRLSKLFAQRSSAQAQEWHQMLQNILRESHSEDVIQKLVAYVDQNPHNETMQQEVFQYIQWLSPNSPDILLKAFVWANSFATRQLWCKSLAAKYKEEPRQLMSGVISPESIIVRNTCAILGEIGHVSVRPLLQRASKHDDPEVRAEATRALLQFGGGQTALPQLYKLLKQNLFDDNPELRRSAIQGIPQLGQRGIGLLRELYKNRSYEQWESCDQRQLFDVTIRQGQRFPESIDLMVNALMKHYSGWLASRKDPILARTVVQSLQKNGSSRAISAIEKLYSEGSEPIQKACEYITQRL